MVSGREAGFAILAGLSHMSGASVGLSRFCSMDLIPQQASLGMLPQQKQKSEWECRNASSFCLSHICCHSLGQNKCHDLAQSQEMGQNTPDEVVVQGYIAKGFSPGRDGIVHLLYIRPSVSHIVKIIRQHWLQEGREKNGKKPNPLKGKPESPTKQAPLRILRDISLGGPFACKETPSLTARSLWS